MNGEIGALPLKTLHGMIYHQLSIQSINDFDVFRPAIFAKATALSFQYTFFGAAFIRQGF
ncbi:hypothetical protein AS219_01900 [Neorickettsia sp. 179522]|nr:hypothetical protein AS219_01900 [Neorickettsia sp. 179522]